MWNQTRADSQALQTWGQDQQGTRELSTISANYTYFRALKYKMGGGSMKFQSIYFLHKVQEEK